MTPDYVIVSIKLCQKLEMMSTLLCIILAAVGSEAPRSQEAKKKRVLNRVKMRFWHTVHYFVA